MYIIGGKKKGKKCLSRVEERYSVPPRGKRLSSFKLRVGLPICMQKKKKEGEKALSSALLARNFLCIIFFLLSQKAKSPLIVP